MSTKEKSEKKSVISRDVLAAMFNTSEFKQYSHDCRQEVVESLEGHEFKTLLDLDCGGGKMLEQLFETFPDMEACGFDYSLDLSLIHISRTKIVHNNANSGCVHLVQDINGCRKRLQQQGF